VAARALQDQFTLTPVDGSAHPAGIPGPDPRVPEELAFWERLRVAVQAFPPPVAEAEMLARLEPLGLLSKTSPYLDPHPDLTDLLVGGQAVGEATIEQLMKDQPASATGWQPATHIRLQRPRAGDRDDRRTRVEDRGTEPALRDEGRRRPGRALGQPRL
jgi:hypothetical protein